MRTVRIAAAMGDAPEPLAADAGLEELLERFGRADALPVVDGDGRLVGIVTSTAVEEEAMTGSGNGVTAEGLARPVRELRADALLEDAVHELSTADVPALPVLAAEGPEVVGWVTHRDVLRAYHRERARLSAGSAPHPDDAVAAPSPATT